MSFLALAASVSTGVKAVSQYMASKIEADELRTQAMLEDRNASILEQDAVATEFKTRFDQVQHVIRGDRILESLRARLGASGARLDIGAPDRVLAAQSVESAFENSIIGFTGQVKAQRERSQAASRRLAASVLRSQGRSSERIGRFQAVNTVLGGITQMAQIGMFSGSGSPSSVSAPAFSTGAAIQNQRMAHFSSLGTRRTFTGL